MRVNMHGFSHTLTQARSFIESLADCVELLSCRTAMCFVSVNLTLEGQLALYIYELYI